MKAKPRLAVGQRYGQLTLLEQPTKFRQKVLCLCTCGTQRQANTSDIWYGKSLRCKECSNKAWRTRHPESVANGFGGKRLYKVWKSMRERCRNPKCRGFKNYGGRGIVVCEEWDRNYRVFRDWANGSGYMVGLSIDRIDNNGNYDPANCRWVTPKTQSRNTRKNIIVSAFGVTKTLAAWAEDERCKVTYTTLLRRIHHGCDAEFAMTDPPQCGMRLPKSGSTERTLVFHERFNKPKDEA